MQDMKTNKMSMYPDGLQNLGQLMKDWAMTRFLDGTLEAAVHEGDWKIGSDVSSRSMLWSGLAAAGVARAGVER